MNKNKDLILPPLVLTIICIVVSFALAGTYNLTQPIIQQKAKEAASLARGEVLPGAKSFDEVTVDNMPEGGIDCYKATDGSGYVITGFGKGYGGPVKVMVGIKNDGTIAGTKVLEQSETAGLGTRILNPEFSSQFVGKDAELKDVETISGATISSRAFLNALRAAYQVYGSAAGVTVKTGGEPFRELLTLDTVKKIFPAATSITRLENKLEAYRVEGTTGYVIVAHEEGFESDLVAAVSFDADGKIAGVTLTQINETPDYGMRAAQPSYLEKYIGLTDVSGVELISGATVTSTALQKLVGKTVEAFPAVKIAAAPVSLVKLQNMMTELYGAATPAAVEGAKYALKSDKGTGLVMTTEGFGGEYEVLVVVGADGSIAKVALGKNEESEGYGSKTGEAAYTDRYIGKTAVDDVESIAGATITSDSFKKAVQQALELVKGA